MLSMILAIDKNNLVGRVDSQYGLAWHYPEDMTFYKNITSNKKNIMGRITFEAIGRALPNRETYVMTKSNNTFEGAKTIHSVEEVIELNDESEIMIIGGVEIFRALFNHIDKIYLTKIDEEHEGDVFYDDLNLSDFKLVENYYGEDKRLNFQTWVRK